MAPKPVTLLEWMAGTSAPKKKTRPVMHIQSESMEAHIFTDDAAEMDYAIVGYPRHASARRPAQGSKTAGSESAKSPPEEKTPPKEKEAPKEAPPPPNPTEDQSKNTPNPTVMPVAPNVSQGFSGMASVLMMTAHAACTCANCVMGRVLLKELGMEPPGKARHDGVSDGENKAPEAKKGAKEKKNKNAQDCDSDDATLVPASDRESEAEIQVQNKGKKQGKQNQQNQQNQGNNKKGDNNKGGSQNKGNQKEATRNEDKTPDSTCPAPQRVVRVVSPSQSPNGSGSRLDLLETTDAHLIIPRRSKVVDMEHVYENPARDPQPNAYIDVHHDTCRVYHGPTWGAHFKSVYPEVSVASPGSKSRPEPVSSDKKKTTPPSASPRVLPVQEPAPQPLTTVQPPAIAQPVAVPQPVAYPQVYAPLPMVTQIQGPQYYQNVPYLAPPPYGYYPYCQQHPPWGPPPQSAAAPPPALVPVAFPAPAAPAETEKPKGALLPSAMPPKGGAWNEYFAHPDHEKAFREFMAKHRLNTVSGMRGVSSQGNGSKKNSPKPRTPENRDTSQKGSQKGSGEKKSDAWVDPTAANKSPEKSGGSGSKKSSPPQGSKTSQNGDNSNNNGNFNWGITENTDSNNNTSGNNDGNDTSGWGNTTGDATSGWNNDDRNKEGGNSSHNNDNNGRDDNDTWVDPTRSLPGAWGTWPHAPFSPSADGGSEYWRDLTRCASPSSDISRDLTLWVDPTASTLIDISVLSPPKSVLSPRKPVVSPPKKSSKISTDKSTSPSPAKEENGSGSTGLFNRCVSWARRPSINTTTHIINKEPTQGDRLRDTRSGSGSGSGSGRGRSGSQRDVWPNPTANPQTPAGNNNNNSSGGGWEGVWVDPTVNVHSAW